MAKAGDAFIDIHGDFTPLNKQISGMASGRLGQSMQKVGKSLTRNLTLPMVAVGGVAVKMSLDFQRSMSLIATQAGGSKKEVAALSKEVLNLSRSSEFGPQQLSEALFHVESVGYRGAKAMKVLNASAELAAVGHADLESTTNALVGAMRTGIKGAQDMHEAIGTLNATVGAGNLRMEDLTAAMGTGFLVSAKQVGLTLRDAGAALAELTSQGVPASAAATRLRMTFSLMAAPTEKAKDALKGIGLDGEALAKAMQKPNGLVRSLALLKDHLQGLSKIQQTQVLSEAFGGARSGTTVMALIGQLGDLNKKYAEIGRNAGDFNKKLRETEEQPLVKLQKAWNSIQADLIEIGSALIPVVVPAFQKLAAVVGDIAHWFGKLPEGTKQLIVDAALAVAALGPVLTVGGKLLTTYARLKAIVMATSEAFAAMRAASVVGSVATGTTAADMFGVNAAAAKAASGSAGMAMARNLAGGIAKGIGPALAAYGIGNIIVSATHKDWRDAGFEAGGALAGGIAGFFLGGPVGAMIGVGAGSFLGELGSKVFGSIFNSGKELSPLQKQLARTSEQLTEAMKGQRAAGQNLAQANKRLSSAQRDQKHANEAVKRATDEVAAARKRYGRDSDQAARAEARLRNQKALSAAADRRLANAERLHGASRTAAIRSDRAAVAATKERSEALTHQYSHLMKLLRAEQQQPPSKARLESERKLTKRLNEVGKERTETTERESRVIKEAAQQIGGKFARSLEKLTASQERILESGRSLKSYYHELGEAVFGFSRKSVTGTGRVKGAYERLKGVYGPFRTESHAKLQQASGDVTSWWHTTNQGVGQVENRFNTFAGRLGIGSARFGLAGGGKQRGGRIGFQVGGFTVPGYATGDVFHTALPVGSFVMNRKATEAYGFQAGGLMPVALEPKERVFLPPEVQRLGAGNLEAMNRAVPRFQQGGQVSSAAGFQGFKPPIITGPDPLRMMGQAAVNKVFEAAVKLLQRAGGHRSYQAVLKEANRIDALKLPYVWGGGHQSSPAPPNGPFDCSGAVSALLQGAGFRIPTMVSSGFEAFGSSGAGKVSVLANPEHVYTVIGGRAWGTSGENPGGGAGWIDGYTFRPGFTVRHADLLNVGQIMHGRTGKGQAAKKGFARGGLVAQLLAKGGLVKRIVKGKVSWFGGGATAGGKNTSQPGIALNLDPSQEPGGWDNAITQGWMKDSLAGHPVIAQVTISGHSANLPIIDKGPASWTGRAIDVTEGGVPKLGFSTSNFPTDAIGTAVIGGGTAGAGGSTKPKVPAKVHGKYTKHAPGQTGPGGGTYGSPVKGKYTAQTQELKFGALPKTEDACIKELYHLEKVMLPEYRAASKQHPDKATAKALLANQKRIEKRILEVRKQLRTLRITASKKRLTKRLAKAMQRITGWEGAIEAAQRAYEAASQYAEQVVAAEPLESSDLGRDWVEHVLAPYITGQEEPAYAAVLGTEAKWRNTIIRAQSAVGAQEYGWVGNISDLAGRIGNLGDEIDKDNRRIGNLRDLIRAHPTAKDRPQWEAERDPLVAALPGMHQRLDAMRARRKQIVEALTEAKGSWDPWKGTGSFEDSMTQVQGIHWPAQHEVLAALPAVPVPGNFGGAIWDTQTSMQELGLKIKQALESASGGEAEGSSEKTQLLEQLLREERERLAISQAQYKVFEGFTAIPNFGGSFATGGIVPGRRGEPKVAITHAGEGVFTPDQMAAMGVALPSDAPSHHIQVVVEDGAVDKNKIRVEAAKVINKRDRSTARGVSRRIPSRAGVFG